MDKNMRLSVIVGAVVVSGLAVLWAVTNTSKEVVNVQKVNDVAHKAQSLEGQLENKALEIEEVEEKAEVQPQQKVEAMSVVELESGLKYKVIQKGVEGCEKPRRGQQITVHYTGYLAQANNENEPDTTRKFDSSVDRGQPFKFVVGVGQVIKGWDEGLMDMIAGEKRRLIIPAHLGYGARGVPGVIPANATLIFDVELF